MMYIAILLLSINLAFSYMTPPDGELKFIASIFRHGARGPIDSQLDYQSHYNTFWNGELTPTGQRQHYVLGQTLRERYIMNSDLGLSTNYNHTEIYCRSTDVNRTIISAVSQLSGLYPPGTGPFLPEDLAEYLPIAPYEGAQNPGIGKQALPYNYQNIPVHTVPKPEDDVLSPTDPHQCPSASYWQQLHDGEMQPQIDQINEYYADVMQQFTDLFQLDPPMEFSNCEDVWDVLIADKFNGQRPEGYDEVTDEMWEGITQLDSLYWLVYNAGSPEFVKIGTSRVLLNWVEYSEVALGNIQSDNLKNLKYLMYSCHDDNLVNMMSALNFTSFDCLWDKYTTGSTDALNCYDRAYYAASIIYELYAPQDQDPYVKILFDGEYANICNEESTVCSFEDFKQIILNYTTVDGEADGELQLDYLCHYQPPSDMIVEQYEIPQKQSQNILVEELPTELGKYKYFALGALCAFLSLFYYLRTQQKQYHQVKKEIEFQELEQTSIL